MPMRSGRARAPDKADLPELRKRGNDDADEHIQDKVVRDRKEYDGVAARPVQYVMQRSGSLVFPNTCSVRAT